jgi:hypothetical protein
MFPSVILSTCPGLLKRIQPDAAGIDCGATSHVLRMTEGETPDTNASRPSRQISAYDQPTATKSVGSLSGAIGTSVVIASSSSLDVKRKFLYSDHSM